MLRISNFYACLISLTVSSLAMGQPAATVDPEHAAKRTKGLEIFRTDVRKILKDKCVSCHGGDTSEGKLDLATQEGLLKGGDRGPAAVIGRGDKSLITRLIRHQQEPHMPKDEPKLSEREITAVVNWIDLGAPYDEPLVARQTVTTKWTERKVNQDAKSFWSFQPLKRVAPPTPADAKAWCQSPIDRFILAKLNEAKLQPNSSVGRAALIRRVYFDITGLPPSAEEVSAFESDPRPDAYERMVEKLLADPHYGERWGRFWLDLARFAESHGFEHDYDRPSAYHYRDFVVQALNQGMPYDQFVRWQLAGDELAPNDRLAMMATGYLAAGVHSTQITKNEVEKHRYDEMDDMLNTVGTSMLGLSIGCARCHDHPLISTWTQHHYYGMAAFFTQIGAKSTGEWKEEIVFWDAGKAAAAGSQPAVFPDGTAAQLPAQRERQRHRRVEMSAGDRAEDKDQHDQDRSGRDGVAEQRERNVAAGELGPHDPRADDRR